MKTVACLLLATVARLAAQITVESMERAAPELAVFGGGEAVLRVGAQAGRTVVYDLFQMGGSGLAAPLVTRQHAATLPEGREGIAFAEVRVPVPKVKRPTRMVVQFSLNALPLFQKSASDRAWLTVFPHPLPGEWRDALAAAGDRSGRRLAVFGESSHVRAFFGKHDIAFHDLGSDFPETFPSDAVTVGEVAPDVWETRRPTPGSGRQLIFVEDPFVPPGVYEFQAPGGALTKVTLPIPAELTANPKAQITFVNLLHHNLESATP